MSRINVVKWRRLDDGKTVIAYHLGSGPGWEHIVRDVCAEFHCWPEQVDLEEGTEEDGEYENAEFITVRGERVVRKDYVA